jgi:hypothetical protein
MVRAVLNVVVVVTVCFWVETLQTFCFPPLLVVKTLLVRTQRVVAHLTVIQGVWEILPEIAVFVNATLAPRTKSVFAIFTPPAVKDSPLLVQSMAALLIRTRF